ncbi:MAG: hypothetical protein HY886_06770 [Deltaproteobacteria bacterium]|nr:hypothetical protein [Deltaproteobacteria bacterium]
MSDAIRVLEQIQRLDLEIGLTEEEEKRYLRDIEGIKVELQKAQDEMEKLKPETEALNAQISLVDEKIRISVEKIARDEKRLSEIKNAKELGALNKEVSAANKSKKAGEEEKARLSGAVDEKNEIAKSRLSFVNAKNDELNRLNHELAVKKETWAIAISGILERKESFKAGLRPDIFKKYETIRAKRGGVGLARVEDETCQACYIHIPPQVYIILKRGAEELLTCPHCHRILYVDSQVQAPV